MSYRVVHLYPRPCAHGSMVDSYGHAFDLEERADGPAVVAHELAGARQLVAVKLFAARLGVAGAELPPEVPAVLDEYEDASVAIDARGGSLDLPDGSRVVVEVVS